MPLYDAPVARHLITSALPYINGVKHLGNLVGSMLPADVYARHQRLRGHDVLFICATDEHGTPAELAAAAAGLSVADYCAEQHEIQADLARRYGLSFDHFGRSSSTQNAELTRHMAEKLRENGMVEERVTDQVYSLDDERFLPDRYIIGTCPHCGYERANGDQCENCARLLEPSDLINPRSAISGSTRLEVRATRHLFIRQSLMADRVREWIDSHDDWPILVSSIARNWLNVGLEDRSITRDLKWGIPVGWPGFENKVFYVWFDAPIEYIGATKEWADLDPGARDWRSWWFDARDVRYTEFLGKDNIPFHTINFPITLMGTGEPWKLVDYVKGFNYLTYYGGKFSTSQQRGIFMDTALDIVPADYWRYALLASAPKSDDAEFTWEGFALTVNKDLAGHLRQLRATHAQAHREAVRHGRARPAASPARRRPSWRRRSMRHSRPTPRRWTRCASGRRHSRCGASGRSATSTSTAARPGTRPTTRASPASCAPRSTSRASRRSSRHRSCRSRASAWWRSSASKRRRSSGPGPAAGELTRLAPGRTLHAGEPLFPRIGDRSTLAAWVSRDGDALRRPFLTFGPSGALVTLSTGRRGKVFPIR